MTTNRLEAVFHPQKVIDFLANNNYSPSQIFFGYALWICLIPPISAFFGTYNYGWPLGVAEPIILSFEQALIIAIFYAFALIAGFLSTALVIKWMSSTYATDASLKDSFSVVSLAITPIMLGGVLHFYPNILLHIFVLAPIFAWSVYLLFVGIPTLLKTDQEQGVMMGCSVLTYLVTAFLGLLGLSAILWVYGVGPSLGVWYG